MLPTVPRTRSDFPPFGLTVNGIIPYTDPVTETLTLTLPLEAVPADWGVYDASRLATLQEMSETEGCCTDCGVKMRAKVGGGVVQGGMVGYRFAADDMWVWAGPYCYDCERDHSIADGY